MHSLPPGFGPEQLAHFVHRARSEMPARPKQARWTTDNERQFTRWQRLQSSAAKIVAGSIATHAYASLRVRTLYEQLVDCASVDDFANCNVAELSRDFDRASFHGTFELFRSAVGALRETIVQNVPPAESMLESMTYSEEQKQRFCNAVAAKCRREFHAAATEILAEHANAKAGRGALDAAVDSSAQAHAGAIRAIKSIRDTVEGTYLDAVLFVTGKLTEGSFAASIDWARMCEVHLEETSRHVSDALYANPRTRDELRALDLDAETRALVLSCSSSGAATIATKKWTPDPQLMAKTLITTTTTTTLPMNRYALGSRSDKRN